MAPRLLRKREVCARISVNPATLWRWVKDGNFPEPVILNPNCRNPPIAWHESEIDAWIASRPAGGGRALPREVYERHRRAADAVTKKPPGHRVVLQLPQERDRRV